MDPLKVSSHSFYGSTANFSDSGRSSQTTGSLEGHEVELVSSEETPLLGVKEKTSKQFSPKGSFNKLKPATGNRPHVGAILRAVAKAHQKTNGS